MKKVIWSFSLLVMALFLSCREDDADRFFSGQNDKLIINFSVQDPTSGLATRSAIAPEAGEENVKTLDLFFFESNSTGTGTFKGLKELIATPENPLVMNTDMVFDFSDIGLSMTEPYDILIVANMGDNYLPTDGSQTLADWKSVIQRKNYKEAKAEIQVFMSGTDTNVPEYTTKPLESDALLMSASLKKVSKILNLKLYYNVLFLVLIYTIWRRDILLRLYRFGMHTRLFLYGTENRMLLIKMQSVLRDFMDLRTRPEAMSWLENYTLLKIM